MIDFKKYSLKELEECELKFVLDWRNSERVRMTMYNDHKITMLEHEKWFEKVKKNSTTLVKLLQYENRPIGLVTFSNIDSKNNKCYWGFYIGEQNAPRGSGTIMGLLGLEFIFERVGIRKLCAEIVDFNEISFNYHKKLGFEEEGRFIKHVLKNGNYIDVISMALFCDKWKGVKKKLLLNMKGA